MKKIMIYEYIFLFGIIRYYIFVLLLLLNIILLKILIIKLLNYNKNFIKSNFFNIFLKFFLFIKLFLLFEIFF